MRNFGKKKVGCRKDSVMLLSRDQAHQRNTNMSMMSNCVLAGPYGHISLETDACVGLCYPMDNNNREREKRFQNLFSILLLF